ncbi:hypothetical protein CASFOL_040948 [Castilleja foliolosa]|uniref:C3H1-type domain-containing protein n=1 Tax=Castilleja foliolosa TaxID=1961234 RepID=A0ABD3BEP7_9LAMI
MPGNRKLQRNGLATDRVEEAMRGLKVEENENGRVSEPVSYPDRPGEPDCLYYLRTGSCGYGTNCRFNHPSHGGQVDGAKNISGLPERDGQPDCEFYLKTGTCKYGPLCKYHHPKDKRPDDAVMNAIGLPMRQDVKPCPYYMRTGLCKYGSVCKFDHPEPALDGNALPVVGPVRGSSGSTVVPKPTYYANSLQVPQTYMPLPLYLSPSQGWNAYMGSVNQVGNVLTSPAANGQLPVSYLPDRPDQPECRHFMNFGSCKYGSECKYHHPREKISQLASGSIGPLGLPLRPGQPICSHYSQYGLCKYGPTCRFDHPLGGYSYAYGQTDPPLASAFPPSTLYPRMVTPLVTISDPKTFGDWIKNGSTTAGDQKNQHANTKSVGDSSDRADSVAQHSNSSSVVIQNGSE